MECMHDIASEVGNDMDSVCLDVGKEKSGGCLGPPDLSLKHGKDTSEANRCTEGKFSRVQA
jgi:hypothetical protein